MKKKAIVFTGGGGKGGYQIGAWQALREMGYEPDIVVGTSVGALNGALVALGKFDAGVNIWKNMSMERVFTRFAEDPETKDLSSEEKLRVLSLEIVKNKGADMEPLHELVNENMDEAVIRSSKIKFGLVTTQFPNIKPVKLFVEDMPEGTIGDYIMASAACFPFTKTKKIGETNFVDGGYTQNMPIQMAIDAGAEEIVVIDISGNPETTVIDETVRMHYIRSKFLFNDAGFKATLTFDSELSQEYMRCGYLDTLKEFGLLDGISYYFERGEKYNTKDYEPYCRFIFEDLYSCLPCEKKMEKMSREAVTKYMSREVLNPFKSNSNIIICCEAAASVFTLDQKPVYTLKEISGDIDKALVFQKEKEAGENSDVFSQITEAVPLLGVFEKEKLLYDITVKLLKSVEEGKLSEKEKSKLWLIGITMPELISAAIFCAAVVEKKQNDKA